MLKEEIIKKIKDGGVTGAGGGGFPSHLKLKSGADAVIANGAECEPLLASDLYLMENYAPEIISGLNYAKEASGARRTGIAIKKKYKRAGEELRKNIKKDSGIDIFLLDDYYPAGDELEIVYNAAGKIVPESGLPLDCGCIIFNVNTLFNINFAVKKSLPVTDRFITVAGEVNSPYITRAPLGTPVGELAELAGPKTAEFSIMAGGPMMGKLVSPDFTLTKTCGGVLLFPLNHPVVLKHRKSMQARKRRGKSICDQCFDCSIVCPRNLLGHDLEPHKIMRQLFMGTETSFSYTGAFLCSQCGLCDMYACPLDLSPRSLLKSHMEALLERGIDNPHRRKNTAAHPEKEYRKVNSSRLAARIGVDKYMKDKPVFKKVDIKNVKINLLQHAGAPSIPLVKPGEEVQKGQLIAEKPEGVLGAGIHASLSGRVQKVTSENIEIKKGEKK